MKKSILYTLSLLAAAATFFACEEQNTPEPVRTQYPSNQSPIVRDDAYYARLRAYKQTPHELAFGWYGSWTAIGSSEQTRLQSAPDSMDIISIWSTWHSLSREQMADKAFVQQVLGTKVVFCISAKNVPAEFRVGGVADGEITEESVIAYAKAWGKDSMDKYQYDGMDIDFETAADHMGDLNRDPVLFKKFCTELSKYIGPASGTGRLFIIDGNFDAGLFPEGVAELCNYAVGQAYGTSFKYQLDSRVSSAASRGWKNEQMIFTENFESMWQNGGNTDYLCSDNVKRPSLLGMADYAKTTPAVGFGSYHMEYEYAHADMPYKFMRRAIQLANPAPIGDYSKILISLNEVNSEKYDVVMTPSGIQITEVEIKTPITAYLASIAPVEINIPLTADQSLVTSYNNTNYTEYKALDPSLVVFSGPLHFPQGALKADNSVEVTIPDFASLEDGEYLVPICADIAKVPGYSFNMDKQAKYIFIKKSTSLNTVGIIGADIPTNKPVQILQDGSIVGTVSVPFTAESAIALFENATMPIAVDPTLVAAYNTANKTNYAAVAAADVTITGTLSFTAGSKKSSTATLSMPDVTKLTEENSMIALRMTLPEGAVDYKFAEKKDVLYVIIKKTTGGNVNPVLSTGPDNSLFDRIDNRDNKLGWDFSLVATGDGQMGAVTVAPDVSKMFNDDYDGWMTVGLASRWAGNGSPAQVTLDLKTEQKVAHMVWKPKGQAGTIKTITKVLISSDGSTWSEQNLEDLTYPKMTNKDAPKQSLQFVSPVNTRYIRFIVTKGFSNPNWKDDFGMQTIEIWRPKAI